MIQNVFILGATGNVGSTLVGQIYKKGDNSLNIHQNPTRIIGLAGAPFEGFLFNREGIDEKMAYEFSKEKKHAVLYDDVNEILDIVKSIIKDENVVFIDVTAQKKDLADFHLRVIQETNYGIVTANKNPLSLFDMRTFNQLSSQIYRYGYRCSVMAGAGAVQFIQESRDVNDIPTTIMGCFSGTLGYISSELEKGVPISQAISQAHKQGYTEPHPRDDLNGLDVARKLLILARIAGYDVNLEDINIEPFIPKEYLDEDNVEKFIENTKKLDNVFNQKITEAKANNQVLRYVAKLELIDEKVEMSVSLESVDKLGPLGTLKGTANKIVVINSAYPKENPYILTAPGAGLEVTAQNVRRDLLHQLIKREVKIEELIIIN